jgi:hypothetical protein
LVTVAGFADTFSTLAAAPTGCTKTWAMLIKRVYELDPLSCPRCGPEMKLVAFLDPPQGEVIEKILRHCGLWRHSAPTPPPDLAGVVHGLDGCFSDIPTGSCDQAGELTFVDMDTFLATF